MKRTHLSLAIGLAVGLSCSASLHAQQAADASKTPTAATTDYPVCSRTVTDKCIQREGGAAKPKMHRRHK